MSYQLVNEGNSCWIRDVVMSSFVIHLPTNESSRDSEIFVVWFTITSQFAFPPVRRIDWALCLDQTCNNYRQPRLIIFPRMVKNIIHQRVTFDREIWITVTRMDLNQISHKMLKLWNGKIFAEDTIIHIMQIRTKWLPQGVNLNRNVLFY